MVLLNHARLLSIHTSMYLLPNIDLAWLRRFTRCNRLGHAQKMTYPTLPPLHPITESLLFLHGAAIHVLPYLSVL